MSNQKVVEKISVEFTCSHNFRITVYSRHIFINIIFPVYRSADKSLARPNSRCILFDGENISFDASLVIYINSINISPITIINRIHETQNLLSL